MKKISPEGFTLIEILIVIGILSILILAVFVALDPIGLFAEGRNVRRWNDVNNITTAIYRSIIDNDVVPSGITSTEKQLGTASSGCNSVCTVAASGCLDLSTTLSKYLPRIPQDPKGGTEATTYYSVVINSDNVVTVKSCNAENDVEIQISR